MAQQNVAGALLDAGAVLTLGAAPIDDDTVDVLTARSYAHPVLDGRTVVSLVPRTLGPAEDLTMEFLGFATPEPVVDVGVVRQQALGFPAWALVHDPANGHHALALVKDIERLARIAKSRIGPAKEGFDALADQLSRSVPHFLPTYYEEAARAFIAAESPTYAASMFGKARDAERSYGLAIDEDRQHAVFLEFALAGALTAKALSAQSRELASRCAPDVAHDRFRRLCIERTLGGLPPYAAMHADLRRLAGKAGLGDAADEQFLAEILTAPSIIRAPAAFWVAYRPVLARLARRDPAVSGRLLTMFPSECADDVWLGILEESGATAALTGPAGSVVPEAESADGPAGWLRRFDDHREGYRRTRLPALLALLERMADRLRADGVPVALCRSNDTVDLDLVDLALSLSIPLTEPSKKATYRVQPWFVDSTAGRRDLEHLAANTRMRTGLAASIESYLQPGWRTKSTVDPEKVAAVVAVPGMRTAVSWWLDTVADRVAQRGLPNLGKELDRVALLACPDGLAVNPDAVRRILDHQLGPVLGRTLRAGVLDEFGWPALDSAATTLSAVTIGKDDDEQLQTVAQWPQLIVRMRDQVLVVDGAEIVHEHLLRIPADQRGYMWRIALRYVDRQLLVSWDVGSERHGYWSGAPDDVFGTPDDAFSAGSPYSIALPGGGRTAGGRPLHVGDRSAQERSRVASDGANYWVRTGRRDQRRWYEYDVETGEVGRASVPAFFEDGAVDGAPLDLDACRLLPVGSGTIGNPLGSDGSLVGWRVRTDPDGTSTGVGIDSRSFTLSAGVRGGGSGLSGDLLGAFRFPGSETTYGLIWNSGYRDNSMTLCDSDGFVIGHYKLEAKRSKFAKGTPLLAPPSYWHYLRPRDETGSAALRSLTDVQAQALLTGATDADHAAVAGLVRQTLPEVTDAALIAGIAGIVRQAAKHAARLVTFDRMLAGEAVGGKAKKVRADRPEDAELPTDHALSGALHGFIPYCYDRGRSAARLFAQLGAALTGPDSDVAVVEVASEADDDWLQALSALPVAMVRAASPVTSSEHRDALLGLLSVCGNSGLLTHGSRLRVLQLTVDTPDSTQSSGDVIRIGDRRFAVLRVDRDDREITVLEAAPDGRFTALPGFGIKSELRLDTLGVTPEIIAGFVALVRERGPIPWRADLVQAAARAAGMSVAEAATILAGMPTEETWAKGEPGGWRENTPCSAEALKVALNDHDDLSRADGVACLATLLPDDVSTMWGDGPSVDRLAAWWIGRHGVRMSVPDDLIVQAYRAGIGQGLSASELLHGVANPDTCRWLQSSIAGTDDDDVLVSVARVLPWLLYRLAGDDRIRGGLPRVLERVRSRLADPGLLVDVGYLEEKKIGAFTNALGTPVIADEHGIDAGAVFFPPDSGWRAVQVRPSRLTGSDDPVLAMLSTRLESSADGTLAAIRILLGDQLTEWVNYQAPADIGGSGYDPSRSAPAVVAEVADRHRLGADAATLYLQLLALPDPTDRHVAGWTGWKPARLKAARAELAGTVLVVDAKRTRAGRTLFLPGGWLALKAPHLPLERWKLPLLVGGAGAIDGLEMVVPIAPVPRLFELAWARVRDGDAPRFDDLVTGRRT